MTLPERIAQFLEAEEKSTRGPWGAHRSTTDLGEWLMGIDMPNGKDLPDYPWISTDREAGTEWTNAEFISLAKNLAPQIIRDQEAIIRVMREALVVIQSIAQCSGPPQQCREYEFAREALAQAKALEEK